jgi:hypothetical protein
MSSRSRYCGRLRPIADIEPLVALSGMQNRMAIFLTALLVGCAAPEVTELPSPDGKLIARLIDDRGGGAASSAYQSIEVQDLATGDRKTVFEGENMGGRSTGAAVFGDVNLSWRSQSVLLIEYCGGQVNKLAQSVELGGTPVQVILAQERRGAWPASIPVDRRAGPPPCS